ncbi:MAG: excinuclease ABC subunit UvrA [Prevotellaceae bacterium]|jgi:excinuclease ABC subunit A|nr:excinuclease ABC subunit UvrA [Prevotellaceae bacterium]
MEIKNETSEEKEIVVTGARVHNLKNITVAIPRNKLTVITGLSGSGKSSLAFDTIYAEGQRRYMETMSAYARQFLGVPERPDVEHIAGLSPVISIEQKTTGKNPRSTVGTITEIYDFLRLLYARAGTAYSSETDEEMVRYTDNQIVELIIEKFNEKKTAILAPLVKGRKGHYKELFEQLMKKGFSMARIDGELNELHPGLRLDRYKNHFVEVVIDRLVPSEKDAARLRESTSLAMKHGKGVIMVLDMSEGKASYYSRTLMCPTTGISYAEPAPHNFSFNSPQGACPRCNGLGVVPEADLVKLIPDAKISIKRGGIKPVGAYKGNMLFAKLEAIAKKYGFSLDDPIDEIPDDAMNVVLYGTEEPLKIENNVGVSSHYMLNFEGVLNIIYNPDNAEDEIEGKNIERYIKYVTCSECKGTRLKSEALHFRIAGKNIAELSEMSIEELSAWFAALESGEEMSKKQRAIAVGILKEIRTRLEFLLDVGLNYLSLSRSTRSLSGGESQRIRLATQIGSKLVNVLYILDEPSIGLHQRDNMKLINSLRQLRDAENSVIVVEHDEDMIRSADYVVDIGPRAGEHGGHITAAGSPEQILASGSLTAQYLNGERKIALPEERRKGSGQSITLKGAAGNNLKNIDVEFPLGMFICVTGVSGSGKSSLVNETLHPILSRHFYRSLREPLQYESIEGIENVDKVVEVDQSPIGRTPRSNPATYSNVFADIRKLFESTPEAKIRGYKAGRFSFNVKGGRCEECRGAGVQTIEMNFLPDVYVRCKVCNGKRYNRETLEVRYKGKSINDVLNLTIDEACEFFEHIPSIFQRIRTLREVGLGYITLGQPCTTLSGGESQRVKLAAELSKRDTGNTFYILDEPTTGLHFEDVRVLLDVLNKLVDKGNTVLVIEHNLDVIKTADYLIDLGPDGGVGGGEIMCTGVPEQVAAEEKGYTSEYLKKVLNRAKA